MTDRDQLREQVARALRESFYPDRKSRAPESEWLRRADAVLAVLPQYEQVGVLIDDSIYTLTQVDTFMGRNGFLTPPETTVVPVYIVREAEG